MIHHPDDRPIGRVLTRREAVALIGVSGLAIVTGCGPAKGGSGEAGDAAGRAAPGCVVRPEQTEGPYFVDELLNRSDLRSDPASGLVKPGTPLQLTINVSRVSGTDCAPLRGARVDVWHCDALGVYSDVADPSFNTVGQKFLRGYQVTDADGAARFTTIYPGWYQGRTVHIHFKVRTDAGAGARGREFTSQLYFPDDLTQAVYAREPYAARGRRTARNGDDGIFRDGGAQLMLAPAPAPSGDGYAASFGLGLGY